MCCGILRHVRHVRLHRGHHVHLHRGHHALPLHDLHGRGVHGRQASLGQLG